MRAAGIFLSVSTAVILLGACGTSPKENFYTLNAIAAAGSAQGAARYSVAVGPVRVPETVDRPQLVVRLSPNRVEVLEQHRWAQPLRSEISRVLAADLSTRLPDAQVAPYSDYTSGNIDYRVQIGVEQFDAVPGEGVTVQAVWAVRRSAGDASKSGHSLIREPARGAGYEELVAAYGRALAAMSTEIGGAVQLLHAGSDR